MASLEEEIRDLKAIIAEFEAVWRAAPPGDKIAYVNLITASRNNLHDLFQQQLQQQQQAQAGGGQGHQQDLLSGQRPLGNQQTLDIQSSLTHLIRLVEHTHTHVNTPPQTPSSLALNTIEYLTGLGNCNTLQDDLHGSKFLNDEQLNQASGFNNERQFVKFMTPIFQDVFGGQGVVVVNSEDFAWLETQMPKTNQKPDLYLVPSWAYEKKTPKENDGRRFGVVSDSRLYDCVYILDCKLEYSNQALGELIIHLQYLCYRQNHARVRGMLFCKKNFYLIECQGIEVLALTTGSWATSGSKECIRDYFKPLLWHGLEAFCQRFGIQVADPHYFEGASSAFLGAGGMGRVCRVLRRDADLSNATLQDTMALKVVQECDTHLLRAEHFKLAQHRHRCSCELLAAPCSNVITINGLSGYVQAPAGETRVTRGLIINGIVTIEQVMQSLFKLHSHQPPIVHGDARLPNLILLVSNPEFVQLFWVDCAITNIFNEGTNIFDDSEGISMHSDMRYFFKQDAFQLVESLFPALKNCLENEYQELKTAIGDYAESPSSDKIDNIVNEVKKLFK